MFILRNELTSEISEYETLLVGYIPEFDFKGFGKLLIKLRISQHISQKSLAEKLHVSAAMISRDERGNTM